MRRGLGTLLLASLTAACSQSVDTAAVRGHWKAENLRIQAVGLPIGPELDIDEHALSVTGTELVVPIKGVSAKGREVTLELPLGVTLSLVLESSDRMAVDVPLAGLVYYRKVAGAVPVSASPAPAAERPAAAQPAVAAAPPVVPPPAAAPAPDPKADLLVQVRDRLAAGQWDQAEALLTRLESLDPAYRPARVERLLLVTRLSGPDEALRQMDQWLRVGLLAPADLGPDPRLAVLMDDPRYRALMARHR